MAKLPMPGMVPQRKKLAMGMRSPVAVATPQAAPMQLKKGGAAKKGSPVKCMKKGGAAKKKK